MRLKPSLHTCNCGQEILVRNESSFRIPSSARCVAKRGNIFARRGGVFMPGTFRDNLRTYSFNFGKRHHVKSGSFSHLGCFWNDTIHKDGCSKRMTASCLLCLAQMLQLRPGADHAWHVCLVQNKFDCSRSESIIKRDSCTSEAIDGMLRQCPFHAIFHVNPEQNQVVIRLGTKFHRIQARSKGVHPCHTFCVTTVNKWSGITTRANCTEAEARPQWTDVSTAAQGLIESVASFVGELRGGGQRGTVDRATIRLGSVG
mmetsp:Transcript_61841/g.182596  ORF Transcript_61841/g.182596 Transcript_61841/m.182596 type:complete len:258 (+) Transcript_61841:1497-2270(+)